MNAKILDAISKFGEASTGQIAAWIREPTADVERHLHDLYAAGMITILPGSLLWSIS